MARKATREFINSVLSALTPEPKSILEISDKAGATWEGTKHSLELLESLGVVESKLEGNRKLFYRKELVAQVHSGTFFDIPLEKRDENLINFIFENARRLWKEKTGVGIGRTQMQKLLVKVNTSCTLDLPVGRYLYGMICVKPYEFGLAYPYQEPENAQSLIAEMQKGVELYSPLSTSELKLLHYKETQNQLYLAKEETLKLVCAEFNRNNFSLFCRSLSDMLVRLPPDDLELIVIFTEFIAVVNNMAHLDEKELMHSKNEVVSTFDEVWRYVAIKLFFKDLSKKYSTGLSKLVLEIALHREILRDAIATLAEIDHGGEAMPRSPEYEELKRLQGSVRAAKELGEAELHNLAEESAKNPSKIFREFGLD